MPILSFKGRSTRFEWWVVSVVLMFAGLGVFSVSVGGAIAKALGGSTIPSAILWTANVVFFLCFYIGTVTSIRRYHDRGKSGWWIFIGAIPLIGTIWQLVELGFLAGTAGDNAYGPAKFLPSVSVSQPVAPAMEVKKEANFQPVPQAEPVTSPVVPIASPVQAEIVPESVPVAPVANPELAAAVAAPVVETPIVPQPEAMSVPAAEVSNAAPVITPSEAAPVQ